jgi:NAD(P)-dependent dehydrogenase (short-subunit alcohol dehydrogenase family)
MGKRLQDKAAIVVGAGTKGKGIGNGKATAIQFAREGARVICVDIDSEAAKETVDIIRTEGGVAEACVGDIMRSEDCTHFVDTCVEKYGKLDVLHNNVGVGSGMSIADAKDANWDEVFNVNAKGLFLICKHAIPYMINGGGGSIINVSTIFSIRPGPDVAYVASKGAVNSLTLYIARFYARHNIRANCLLLGYIDTPLARPAWENEKVRETNLKQVPMHRFASPWEVATAAAFFASDESSYITGTILPIDGGLSLSM